MRTLIEFIPPAYRVLAYILFALFPWIVVGVVALKAWRIAVKKRHGALAYRALEERCRCIVDAAGEAFPELRELRGQEFIDAAKGRLMQAAVILASIQSKNLPPGLPPALAWYVNQVKSIQHHLEEHDYPESGNPAGTILHLLTMDRSVVFPTFIIGLKESNLKPRASKYGVEEMEKQFRDTVGKLAMYARQVTFCDSLPKFAEDVLDVATVARAKYVIQRGQETGVLDSGQFHEMMTLAEEKPL